MPEERVFYLLMSVCEVLMPQYVAAGFPLRLGPCRYYNRAMVGSLVDVNLFGGRALASPFLIAARRRSRRRGAARGWRASAAPGRARARAHYALATLHL